MNPMINMTTHLLMLIFSRSCVNKKQQQKGHSAIGEANKPNFFCRPGGGGGGVVLGLNFAGYVPLPLASLSPYPIIVYSVAIYRTQ